MRALLLLFLTIPLAAKADRAECFIRRADKIVMVRDLWSRRWGLPGGAFDRLPEQVRWQTGLTVVVGLPLGRSLDGTAIFDCSPHDGVISVLPDSLRLLSEKRAFDEIAEASLRNPLEIPLRDWRFESETDLVTSLTSRPFGNREISLALVDTPPIAAERFELRLIRGFQKINCRATWLFFRLVSLLGEEMFLMVLLPFVWLLVERRLGIELFFLFADSALLHGALKEFFAIGRPFHFSPVLQLSPAEGFGFPSGHTVISTVIWGFLASRVKIKGRWLVAGSIIFLVGLSRIFLGVHFPHDVLGGWVVGGGILAAHDWYVSGKPEPYVPLGTWYALSLPLGAFVLVYHFHPESMALFSILIGTGLGLASLRGNHPPPPRSRLARFFIVVAGLLVLDFFFHKTFPTNATFTACLPNAALKYVLMGFWVAREGSVVPSWVPISREI